MREKKQVVCLRLTKKVLRIMDAARKPARLSRPEFVGTLVIERYPQGAPAPARTGRLRGYKITSVTLSRAFLKRLEKHQLMAAGLSLSAAIERLAELGMNPQPPARSDIIHIHDANGTLARYVRNGKKEKPG